MTAKEMFEKLGLAEKIEKDGTIIYRTKALCPPMYYEIFFDIRYKVIQFYTYNPKNELCKENFISLPIPYLQAINKKLEELGWL